MDPTNGCLSQGVRSVPTLATPKPIETPGNQRAALGHRGGSGAGACANTAEGQERDQHACRNTYRCHSKGTDHCCLLPE